MNIDLKTVSFSAPGAYLCITDMTRAIWKNRMPEEGLWLRTVHGHTFGDGLIARIAVVRDGVEVPFSYDASPWRLRLSVGDDCVDMAFDERRRLLIRGNGADLALLMPKGVGEEFLRFDEDRYDINSFPCMARLMFRRVRGALTLDDPGLEAEDQPKAVRMSGPNWALAVEEYVGVYEDAPLGFDVDACMAAERAAFEGYTEQSVRDVPDRFREAARQATYVNWSAVVRPRGLIPAPVMLMSKNWMKNVWTWDCAFNAVACAGRDDEAAWNNLVSPFRMQHESGRLPDLVNALTWIDGYTKPPIHGWAVRKLREAGALTAERRAWIYPRLLKWAQSWYDTMDWDHDGICQYNHGNDSGWDNCTNFKCGAPIEGPDLSAYLVLCWDELAVLAKELGRHDESAEHSARADGQLRALLDHSWDGKRFLVLQSGTHREQQGVDSLFPFLPLILGDRLPRDVFDALAQGIRREARFLTPYGLATESVSSEWYVPDGYWRGPIWAPPMMFIIDGLKQGGETALATDLSERFCNTCATSGFAENFDANTGAGLRDRAYTWTSSVFLILARGFVVR